MSYKDFSGDALATPQIAVGVPWPDSNCDTPSTDGAPYPWEIGSVLDGHVYGAQRHHSRMSLDTPCRVANPYGSGRSLFIDITSANPGSSANSYIRTPPSLGGYVPKYGVGSSQEMTLLVCYCSTNVTPGMTIRFDLEQRSSSGSLIATTTMGEITDIAGINDYKTVALTSDTSLLQATTDYFTLKISVWHINGVSGAYFSLDAWALCFLPGFTPETSGMQSFRDDYVGRNFRSAHTSESTHIRPAGGLTPFRTNQSRNIQRVESMSWEFIRCSQAWVDDLRFFWAANQGMISANDAVPTGYHNQLNGRPWPLVVRPRRPGVKQLFYCDMVANPFPFDIDQQLGFVESTSKYSGVLTVEEVIF